MSKPTNRIDEALKLRGRFAHGPVMYGGELAELIAHVRAQAINDTLHAVRKCEQRSGTCFMVHSILNKRHPDVCDAENCNSIRAMKEPT